MRRAKLGSQLTTHPLTTRLSGGGPADSQTASKRDIEICCFVCFSRESFKERSRSFKVYFYSLLLDSFKERYRSYVWLASLVCVYVHIICYQYVYIYIYAFTKRFSYQYICMQTASKRDKDIIRLILLFICVLMFYVYIVLCYFMFLSLFCFILFVSFLFGNPNHDSRESDNEHKFQNHIESEIQKYVVLYVLWLLCCCMFGLKRDVEISAEKDL